MATNINWPGSVNRRVLNYIAHTPKFPIIEDETDTGVSKRRLRSTFAIRRHSWTMIFNRTEYDIFQIWVFTNLVGGTLPFNFLMPETLGDDVRELRFVLNDGEAYTIDRFDKNSVKISVELEECNV